MSRPSAISALPRGMRSLKMEHKACGPADAYTTPRPPPVVTSLRTWRRGRDARSSYLPLLQGNKETELAPES